MLTKTKPRGNEQGREILFASWHGQKNKITDVYYKKKTAEAMIRLVKELAGHNPFVIGGDFNLEYWELEISNADIVPLSTGYYRKIGGVGPTPGIYVEPPIGYMDYFVYDRLNIEKPNDNTKYGDYLAVSKNLEDGTLMRNCKKYLGHDPVCCLFVESNGIIKKRKRSQTSHYDILEDNYERTTQQDPTAQQDAPQDSPQDASSSKSEENGVDALTDGIQNL